MLGYYQELYIYIPHPPSISVALLPFSVLCTLNWERCYQSVMNWKMLKLLLDEVEIIFCLLHQPYTLWLLKTVGKFPAQ